MPAAPPGPRAVLLSRLAPGDFFHAESPRGASLPCLMLAVTDAQIRARRVTTQETLVYDRRTGREVVVAPDEVVTVITSVAPLPVEIHDTLLWLDRKNRMARGFDDAALSKREIKALLFIDEHYALHPL